MFHDGSVSYGMRSVLRIQGYYAFSLYLRSTSLATIQRITHAKTISSCLSFILQFHSFSCVCVCACMHACVFCFPFSFFKIHGMHCYVMEFTEDIGFHSCYLLFCSLHAKLYCTPEWRLQCSAGLLYNYKVAWWWTLHDCIHPDI